MVTAQHERLLQDAEQATLAADQVLTIVSDPDNARLRALMTRAQAASDQAQQAVVDARLVVATAPEGQVSRNGLDAAARRARSAATDAERAAIEADAIVNRGS